MGSRGSACVVVLGGCGFIGSHICRALVADKRTVRIFGRMYVNRKLIKDIEAQVEVIEGDIARTEDVLEALKDADSVIDLIHTTVSVRYRRYQI